MLADMANCGIAACNLHATVTASFADVPDVTVNELPDRSFCFRVKFGPRDEDTPHSTVGGMSISVPLDAGGDFETALLGGSGALVYVDDLDYWDTQRFTTAEEVCNEITRVMEVIFTPVAVPAPEAPEALEETRTATDGCLYTKAQFVAFYGGDKEWNDAASAPAAPAPTAVAASAPAAVAAPAHDDATSSSDDDE